MAGKKEPEIAFDRLYWMAVMKMQHERRRLSTPMYQELLHQTLTELDIDEDTFESYLDTHRDDLNRTMELAGV